METTKELIKLTPEERNQEKYIVEDAFMHAGLPCVIIFTNHGHRCGYVGVPKDHSLYNINYSDELSFAPTLISVVNHQTMPNYVRLITSNKALDSIFEVHGGLTYSSSTANDKYPISKPDTWWFGFDCAHCEDVPDKISWLNHFTEKERQSKECFWGFGTIRSLEYVAAECISLADQLLEFDKQFKEVMQNAK